MQTYRYMYSSHCIASSLHGRKHYLRFEQSASSTQSDLQSRAAVEQAEMTKWFMIEGTCRCVVENSSMLNRKFCWEERVVLFEAHRARGSWDEEAEMRDHLSRAVA